MVLSRVFIPCFSLKSGRRFFGQRAACIFIEPLTRFDSGAQLRLIVYMRGGQRAEMPVREIARIMCSTSLYEIYTYIYMYLKIRQNNCMANIRSTCNVNFKYYAYVYTTLCYTVLHTNIIWFVYHRQSVRNANSSCVHITHTHTHTLLK